MGGRTKNRIRELREELGWTQEQLAFRARVAVRTISQLELGNNAPRRSTKQVITDTLAGALNRSLKVEDVFPPEAPELQEASA